MKRRPEEIGEIGAAGEAYLAGRVRQAPIQGEFRLSRRDDVPRVDEISEAEQERWRSAGLEAVRGGRVAYGILAAGASTRMSTEAMPESVREMLERSGAPYPKSKALVPAVEVDGCPWTFLDLFLENVRRFSTCTGSTNPIVVLESEANAAEIHDALDASEPVPGDVLEFCQPLEPQVVATEDDLLRARKSFPDDGAFEQARRWARELAGRAIHVPKPAGHGEFLHQLVATGTLGDLVRRGVDWLSVRNIDNAAALLDARWMAILGRGLVEGLEAVVEVSRRPEGAAGKGGALVVRPDGSLFLAEDPSFAGTGRDPRESYYINDAVAVLSTRYLLRIYDLDEKALLEASPADLAAAAERGRSRFPSLVDVKPVRLSGGVIVGGFVRETNLWESTGVVEGAPIGAVGVRSVKDLEEISSELTDDQREAYARTVRFAATKKWEDMAGTNAFVTPVLACAIRGEDLSRP